MNMRRQGGSSRQSVLSDLMARHKQAIIGIGVLSLFKNILLLGSAFFAMIMFDSVLPSHHSQTLVGMLVLMVMVCIFHGIFDTLRAQMLLGVSASVEMELSGRMPQGLRYITQHGGGTGDGLQPVYDLERLRQFIAGPVVGELLDLPWVIISVLFLFIANVWLGVIAFLVTLVSICIGLMVNRSVKESTEWLDHSYSLRRGMAEEQRRHAEIIGTLGMFGRFRDRWTFISRQNLGVEQGQAKQIILYSAIFRASRLLIQAGLLAVGVALAFDGKVSVGTIVAVIILLPQALLPMENAISGWTSFMAARQAWDRLGMMLGQLVEVEVSMLLPPPEQKLEVQQIAVAVPGTQRIIINNMSFSLAAGQGLGIVGPSGSGKTALLRALVGHWKLSRGAIRLDGATLDQWDAESLGRHMGYLPQNPELFVGSVAQNIARFDPDATTMEVIAAAQEAGVHEMILRLSEGYETQVGRDGLALSTGQRKRIAFARALYRQPFVVALDDPAAGLDGEGELAVIRAMQDIRKRFSIFVVVAHREELFEHVDHMIVMRDGNIVTAGPRDRVLAQLRGTIPTNVIEAGPAAG